jgi:cell division protein FtsL
MKRPYFITIFVCTQVFLVFFQIHKHSKIIRLSYQKQKNEQKREELTHQIQALTQQLYRLKEQSSIKQFAQEQLGMKKIKISQIKKLDTLTPTTDHTS